MLTVRPTTAPQLKLCVSYPSSPYCKITVMAETASVCIGILIVDF